MSPIIYVGDKACSTCTRLEIRTPYTYEIVIHERFIKDQSDCSDDINITQEDGTTTTYTISKMDPAGFRIIDVTNIYVMTDIHGNLRYLSSDRMALLGLISSLNRLMD